MNSVARSRPHKLLDAFSFIIHSKATENADENGDFRNGFKSGAFGKRSISSVDRRKRKLLKNGAENSCRFQQRFRALWSAR